MGVQRPVHFPPPTLSVKQPLPPHTLTLSLILHPRDYPQHPEHGKVSARQCTTSLFSCIMHQESYAYACGWSSFFPSSTMSQPQAAEQG